MMMADPETHERVPKHTLLTAAQVKALLKQQKLTLERLPTLPIDDACLMTPSLAGVVKAGDVIQISRTSVSVGQRPYWRRVVEAEGD